MSSQDMQTLYWTGGIVLVVVVVVAIVGYALGWFGGTPGQA